jgi:integrase/recombinase XerC
VKKGRYSLEIENLVDDFLDYLFSVRGYSEKTVESYGISLRQMVENHNLRQEAGIWHLDIMPMRRAIASGNKRTVARKLSAVRSFVRYLREQMEFAVELEGDDPIRVPQTLPKPIEEKYIREVMENADPEGRLILALLYGLGLRISELSAMRPEHISGEWIEIRGKGDKTRQIPIPRAVRRMLEEYTLSRPAGKYLFQKGGVPLNDAQLRYRVQKLFRAHGIKATPHQLRHSFATHLLEHGARISDVSELLGHSSMATTQIYTKLGNEKKLREYMKAHPLGKQ